MEVEDKNPFKTFFLKNLLASELSLSENKGSNFLRTSLKVVPKHTTYNGDKSFLVIFDLPTIFSIALQPLTSHFSRPFPTKIGSSSANVLMEVMDGIIIWFFSLKSLPQNRWHQTPYHLSDKDPKQFSMKSNVNNLAYVCAGNPA